MSIALDIKMSFLMHDTLNSTSIHHIDLKKKKKKNPFFLTLILHVLLLVGMFLAQLVTSKKMLRRTMFYIQNSPKLYKKFFLKCDAGVFLNAIRDFQCVQWIKIGQEPRY